MTMGSSQQQQQSNPVAPQAVNKPKRGKGPLAKPKRRKKSVGNRAHVEQSVKKAMGY